MRTTACLILLPLIVTSCSHSSETVYSAAEIGHPIETTQATIVTSRVVDITGETNLVGPGAGGVAAAATTGALVNGQAGGPLALLAGLVGAGIGYLLQERANDREGVEYVMKMDDGRTVTLVQNRNGDDEPIPDGAPVLVQLNGLYTRIMPDPTAKNVAGNTWKDPDQAALQAKSTIAAPGHALDPSIGPEVDQQ